VKRSEQIFFVRRCLFLAVILGLLAGMISCDGKGNIAPALVGANDGVAGAKAHITAAEKNVEHAKPHADRTGKVLLDAASENHIDAQAELGQTQKQLNKLGENMQSLQTLLDHRDATIEAYDHAWLGGRGRWWLALAKWGMVLAGVLGVGLVIVGLKIRTATWAAYAGRALLSFVPVAGPLVNWAADHLWLGQVKARLQR
jgi:hypothetical protein